MGLFQKQSDKSDKLPTPKEMLAELARERAEKKIKEIRVAAVKCLICYKTIQEYKNPAKIAYTCSTICRRILRGGKRNRRLLYQSYMKRRKEWTRNQEAAYLRIK